MLLRVEELSILLDGNIVDGKQRINNWSWGKVSPINKQESIAYPAYIIRLVKKTIERNQSILQAASLSVDDGLDAIWLLI